MFFIFKIFLDSLGYSGFYYLNRLKGKEMINLIDVEKF